MPFLHMTRMGKQVKSAYKTGNLKIGAFADHSVIATPNCIFAVKEEQEPNKMKAIITEYAGYVPVHDPTTRAAGFIEIGEKSDERDLDPKETEQLKKILYAREGLAPYAITPVSLIQNDMQIRIIQNKKTLECRGIKQEYLDIIDLKGIDLDVEGQPIGPEVLEASSLVYFHNETTTLVTMTYHFSKKLAQEIVSTLQLIELMEESQ